MERGVYINHAYLYCLYAGIFVFVPAHRGLSLDVRGARVPPSSTSPVWCLWLLRFQIAVVYFYAGIAKLDVDWLQARPLSLWLTDRAWYPVIGDILARPEAAYAMAWGGLAFDLLIVPALWWQYTRRAAFFVALVFHATNTAVFGIGTFPWFSIAATMLFFAPEAFRRIPGLRGNLPPIADRRDATPPLKKLALGLLCAYAVVQLAVPLRPIFYTGRTEWTEHGMTFSWRMMLRDKHGRLTFIVREPGTGKSVRTSGGPFTTDWQHRNLLGTPDMILQFAHFLAAEHERQGRPRPAVYALANVSLNGRKPSPLVDPKVDLARERRLLFRSYTWVYPYPGAPHDRPRSTEGVMEREHVVPPPGVRRPTR
jgi:vitamin K-dependent gamma-carboxylase